MQKEVKHPLTLGVNIDHVAVLREARKVNDPDVIHALKIATQSGADQITIHLREDRRHIHDEDLINVMRHSSVPVNLECSIDEKILEIVCKAQPHRVTLVPEKREEVTTEGGLDLFGQEERIASAIEMLHDYLIPVSLFIDPTIESIVQAKELNAEMVELHTGEYANVYAMLHSNLSKTHHSIKELELPRYELQRKLDNAYKMLESAAKKAIDENLVVAAGHGLNYHNVKAIVDIKEITELNIGQSIIARSIFTGLDSAVKEMKNLCIR